MVRAADIASTAVTFAAGDVTGTGVVLLVAATSEGAVVVTDATPFHPVDHTWPDQPGDTGTIGAGGMEWTVTEAVMAAVSEDGTLAVGADIPVKRGTDGWTWLVAHRLDAAPSSDQLAPGMTVALQVDAQRRTDLSRGHSACHLAALALNFALADLWRKDPGKDALGSPNFDGRTNQSSRITENGSVDTYRLGKSLRKAGFDSEALVSDLATHQMRINDQLAGWVTAGGQSWIQSDGASIVDRRSWHCELVGREAVLLCGGTHVDALDAFEKIRVELDASDPQVLVMTTRVTPSAR